MALSGCLPASGPEDEFWGRVPWENIRSDTEPNEEYVAAEGFRKMMNGDRLCRRLEKRKAKIIADGLIAVRYIPLTGTSPRTATEHG